MPPQLGSGMGGPKPMNARPAWISMPTAKSRAACTTMVLVRPGSTWRRLMPSACRGRRPGRRPRRAGTAGTWPGPASPGRCPAEISTPRIAMISGMLVPTAPMTARMITVPGSDIMISVTRLMTSSARSPAAGGGHGQDGSEPDGDNHRDERRPQRAGCGSEDAAEQVTAQFVRAQPVGGGGAGQDGGEVLVLGLVRQPQRRGEGGGHQGGEPDDPAAGRGRRAEVRGWRWPGELCRRRSSAGRRWAQWWES